MKIALVSVLVLSSLFCTACESTDSRTSGSSPAMSTSGSTPAMSVSGGGDTSGTSTGTSGAGAAGGPAAANVSNTLEKLERENKNLQELVNAQDKKIQILEGILKRQGTAK